MKKACISALTAQHFEWCGAIQQTGLGFRLQYLESDLALAEAQAPYIRFFEHAFEWEQMTYVFYPYFWGRKSRWYERVLLDDTDPLFADFLRAGAARVVIAARTGFKDAIDHFLTVGDTPGPGTEDIHSALYLPILTELQEHLKAPGGEVPVDKPWDVKVPTTLVTLRPDDSLPMWVESNGKWVPARRDANGDLVPV